MQKIVPHLWYDTEAKEAAKFYASLFEKSKITDLKVIRDTPSGDAQIVNFELAGQPFMAISAGPYFKFNPSISLMVACATAEEVDRNWQAMSDGGAELIPLGEYEFSKRYGWIRDRYGLSWQFSLTTDSEGSKITPNLLFSNGVCGKAEEAVRFYTEIFENSEIGVISRYGEGEAEIPEAKVNYIAFKLDGVDFSAMDNGRDADYTFNEAFSLLVNCKDQKEIDYFWTKLSAVPEAEQCGWLKDKYGLAWQIVPADLDEILFKGSEEEIRRATLSFLGMKKIVLEDLMKAKQEI